MPENINLDVGGVLTVVSNLRDRNPEAAARTLDVLKLILNREGYLPSDVTEALKPLQTKLDTLLENQQQIISNLGEIMAKADEHAQRLTQQIDANTAQAQKAFGEIRTALDKALENQITQEELDAAVEAARTAARAEATAENEAAVETAFAPLQSKLDAQKAALQSLDDIVPDTGTDEDTDEGGDA